VDYLELISSFFWCCYFSLHHSYFCYVFIW